MIALGIDTGKRNVGWAIIDARVRGIYILKAWGLLELDNHLKLGEFVDELHKKYQFNLIAFERIYNLKGFRTGSYLIEQGGILKYFAEQKGIEIQEISPRETYKQWKASDKKELKKAVCKYYREIDCRHTTQHEIDAIAITITAIRKKRGFLNGEA